MNYNSQNLGSNRACPDRTCNMHYPTLTTDQSNELQQSELGQQQSLSRPNVQHALPYTDNRPDLNLGSNRACPDRTCNMQYPTLTTDQSNELQQSELGKQQSLSRPNVQHAIPYTDNRPEQ
ncbi:hypothetical protein J6590_090613 [Homalodisca vitripennis]|nr:hypothetical protein J6590_090613 [Homalodisca vitripennis]